MTFNSLNRLALVQERTRLLYHLEFLGDTPLKCLRVANDLKSVQANDDQDQSIIDAAIDVLNDQSQRIMRVIKDAANAEAPFSTMVLAGLITFRMHFEF